MNARFPNPLDYLDQVSRSTDEPCWDCGEWRCRCGPSEGCAHCEGEGPFNDDGFCADCEPPDEAMRLTEATDGTEINDALAPRRCA